MPQQLPPQLCGQSRKFHYKTTPPDTPAHCCILGPCRPIPALLNVGADVNAVDSQVWRPLHYAYFGGDAVMVSLLLNRGPPLRPRTRWAGRLFFGHLWAVTMRWLSFFFNITPTLCAGRARIDALSMGFCTTQDENHSHYAPTSCPTI